MIKAAISVFVSAMAMIGYRLIRHHGLFPVPDKESRMVAWSKALSVGAVIFLGTWMVLELLERFPD
jgi:hypothetical protein